jgi:tRNA (guanine-N7-)-methyltransferase
MPRDTIQPDDGRMFVVVKPSPPPRPAPRPYADAPRLPDGERVDVGDVVRGQWTEIELGPGRGGFILERVQAEANVAILGLEIRRKWAAIVDAKLGKLGMSARARVLAEDARLVLPRLGPDGSVRRVFAHFPDPWWKKRHQKRLMLSPLVVDQIARLLERGGELFVQTDVEERAAGVEALIGADARFTVERLADNPYGARSPRERRAMLDGLPVHRLRFVRK